MDNDIFLNSFGDKYIVTIQIKGPRHELRLPVISQTEEEAIFMAGAKFNDLKRRGNQFEFVKFSGVELWD